MSVDTSTFLFVLAADNTCLSNDESVRMFVVLASANTSHYGMSAEADTTP